jgi:hypothetical protein
MSVLLTYDNTNDHVQKDDKSPRYMHSHGELLDDGTLNVTTRTWTDILLAGFHGAVNATLFDANDTCIGKTDSHTYGVDGKWIGQHDRTDYWNYRFDPSVAAQARRIQFTNSWNPNWFQSVQNTITWIGVGLQVLASALAQSGNALMS